MARVDHTVYILMSGIFDLRFCQSGKCIARARLDDQSFYCNYTILVFAAASLNLISTVTVGAVLAVNVEFAFHRRKTAVCVSNKARRTGRAA